MNAVERIKAIFSKALEKKPGFERDNFLTGTCHGDAELRNQVESLLLVHEGAGEFLGKAIVLPPSDFMI